VLGRIRKREEKASSNQARGNIMGFRNLDRQLQGRNEVFCLEFRKRVSGGCGRPEIRGKFGQDGSRLLDFAS